MPLPTGFPTEDFSFSGISAWELSPEGRYASGSRDVERVIVGQTVITRYVKPVEAQIQVLCGLDEADDLEDAVGDTATLTWHSTDQSALLVRAEIKRIPQRSVAEATLTFLI